jgi:hypothetical protein
MGKQETYQEILRQLGRGDWEAYLLRESHLPGPRGNIELGRAVAEEGDETFFRHLLTYDSESAPVNTPQEFLAFCGVLGLGRLLAEGNTSILSELRDWANDARWRTREAVAMALQRCGSKDPDGLLKEMHTWADGTFLEQRAAAAALCEPALLSDPEYVAQVLNLLDKITTQLAAADERSDDGYKALKKGLGYCWSVAVAACPEVGMPLMEKWFANPDRDVHWIMKQNLKKKRLARLYPEWVQTWTQKLSL